MQARLVGAGVSVNDRVAIIWPNQPGFVAAYLAVLRAGAVAVPLNPASPPAELARQLSLVDVSAVVAAPANVEALEALEPRLVVPVLTSSAGEQDDGEPAGDEPEMVPRQPGDLAVLLYTSGTADAPRPAMLTHGNLLANLDQVQRHPGRAVESGDCILGVVPLSHIFGLNAVLGTALFVGARVLLIDDFDPAQTLDLVERLGVTVLVGAPTLYAALAAVLARSSTGTRRRRHRRHRRHRRTAGRRALGLLRRRPPGERSGRGLGPPLGSPAAAGLRPDRGVAGRGRLGHGRTPRPGSIGVPIPDVDIRLVDDDGEEALAGDPGEIWVRGPNVFPGYWHDPEATAIALTPEGWLRTGDIAVVADDGQLSIVDRAKDLIIVSGFNVYPAEVEDILSEHPDVAEVAVVGEADPYRGETVHAFVVTARAGRAPNAPNGGDRADLIGLCALRLARYKCPTEVSSCRRCPALWAGR